MTNPIQRQFRLTFDVQDRLHFDVLNIRHLAKVVDVIVAVHQIDIGEVLEPGWIVVVTVYHEDRYLHRQILVHVVRILVQVGVEFDVLIAKHSLIEHLLQLEEGLTRRLMLVEQVAAKQEEVQIRRRLGDLQNLMEGQETIIAAHFIILFVAQMVVGRDQDIKDVFLRHIRT